MVIGYSFSDRHINDAITEAAQRGALTGMFLVGPAGWAAGQHQVPQDRQQMDHGH
jgi:hypothetical protein